MATLVSTTLDSYHYNPPPVDYIIPPAANTRTIRGSTHGGDFVGSGRMRAHFDLFLLVIGLHMMSYNIKVVPIFFYVRVFSGQPKHGWPPHQDDRRLALVDDRPLKAQGALILLDPAIASRERKTSLQSRVWKWGASKPSGSRPDSEYVGL